MKPASRVEIVIEQLLAQLGRQIGLGVVQERSDVVLQRAFAAALVVQKKWLAVVQHDVARLEIAIKKIIVRGTQQKFGQAVEIVFQRLFVERNAGQPQKVILEIVQIPGDGLAIEAGPRIAHCVIQIASCFDLEAGQHGHDSCDRPRPPAGRSLRSCDFSREIRKASCRPSPLRDRRPGPDLRRRFPVPADRDGENAGKIRGTRRFPRARRRECRSRWTLRR